jgi:hypothetical protein
MNGIPDIERAYLDVEEFRDIQRQTLHLNLSDDGLQNSTANNARCLTDKVKRHTHLDSCREINLIEIGVNNLTRNRVILSP